MQFIRVRRSDVTDRRIENEELIPIENLIKMFKVYGGDGTGIAFVFYDPIKKNIEDWRYDYCSKYLRDKEWERYCEALCVCGGDLKC